MNAENFIKNELLPWLERYFDSAKNKKGVNNEAREVAFGATISFITTSKDKWQSVQAVDKPDKPPIEPLDLALCRAETLYHYSSGCTKEEYVWDKINEIIARLTEKGI